MDTFVNPNTDVSQGGGWAREPASGNWYDKIDEGAVPDPADYVWHNGSEASSILFGLAAPTFGGSSSKVSIFVNGSYGGNPLYIDLKANGVWQGRQQVNFVGGNATIEFAGVWTQAELAAMQVEVYSGENNDSGSQVNCLMAGVTYDYALGTQEIQGTD